MVFIEEEIGEVPILYVLESGEYLPDSTDPRSSKWKRSLSIRPEKPWTIWQFSRLGNVDGVEGGVDVNVADQSLIF